MSRDHLDRYWTPAWCVRALLARLALAPGTRVLEPCVGQEARIATVLRDAGCEVVTGDLDPDASAHFTWDFPAEVALRPASVIGAVGPVDWVITNPPYLTRSTSAAAVIEAALVLCPRVAALLRLPWLEPCADRLELLTHRPPAHILSLPRPAFDGPAISAAGYGSPQANAWIIWTPEPLIGLPPISVVAPAEKERAPRDEMEFAPSTPTQGDLL